MSAELHPVMPTDARPEWAGATWIGVIDGAAAAAARGTAITLAGSAGFHRSRIMVRDGRAPRGYVALPVTGGAIDGTALADAAAALPPAPVPAPVPCPPISVVLCTYDRPQLLQRAIESALAVDYPDFELVVVDNHPASGLTPPVVAAFDDPRIRLASAPAAGLARARNVGLTRARHEIVAFTDDDVIVDRHWLTGLATGFARHPGVACVTGLVPTAELNSLAQAYFDGRVAWSRLAAPDVFTLTDRRPDEPMFPFEVARFGTGANFALRRELARALGGFDEGLGVGSPTGGGEDIDMFLRVVLARRSLAFEPSAMIWHRHRPDLDKLALQVRDYGTGLGAFLAKYAVRPRSATMMLRRAAPGMRHARRITKVDLPGLELPLDYAALSAAELRGMLAGPLLLARARREGRRARPLASRFTTAAGAVA